MAGINVALNLQETRCRKPNAIPKEFRSVSPHRLAPTLVVPLSEVADF